MNKVLFKARATNLYEPYYEKWITGYLTSENTIYPTMKVIDDDGYEVEDYIYIDENTICHTIGTTDDKGNEVFTNDIVVYTNEDGIFMATIELCDGVQEGRLPFYSTVDKVDLTDAYECEDTDFFIVVGNKHDTINLDLIEEFAKSKLKNQGELE